MTQLVQRLKKLIKKCLFTLGIGRRWQNIEYFDESWRQRIEQMSQYIEPKEGIVDLGCGKMWLREYLNGNPYVPVDYVSRDGVSTVADFNKHQYPETGMPVAFVSGALEYVMDYEWFVKQIALTSKKCILSYCTVEDYPDMTFRNEKTWKNHLSQSQVVHLFEKNGMKLQSRDVCNKNRIFVFHKDATGPGSSC
jgi:hypothetical protein